MKNFPLITFGIVSCNRLYYLRALIESAKICVTYPNCEWIVVDNASTESGLKEYLKSEKLINNLILREKRSPSTEHMDALNLITEQANGDFIIILSDDVQFIRKNWEQSFIKILLQDESITSVSLSALRRVTIKKIFLDHNFRKFIFMVRDLKYFKKIRFQKKVRSNQDLFHSFGYMRDPIDGVGMQVFSRLKLWKELGKWQAGLRFNPHDSSSGGEENMLKRALMGGINGHMVTPHYPVLATIVTDSIGLNARVRGEYRYGRYFPPPSGDLYYDVRHDLPNNFDKGNIPLNFEDIVRPIGYELPLDIKGGLIKEGVNMSIRKKI